MDILSDISPYINGGFSVFNLYILFRIITIEREVEREKRFFLDFRKNEAETNKELDSRIRKIEFKIAKIWSH